MTPHYVTTHKDRADDALHMQEMRVHNSYSSVASPFTSSFTTITVGPQYGPTHPDQADEHKR
jgi:hypothetical protein